MICRNCGQKIKSNENFCIYCGTKVHTQQQSTQKSDFQHSGAHVQTSLNNTQRGLYSTSVAEPKTRNKRRKHTLIFLCCLWVVVALACLALVLIGFHTELFGEKQVEDLPVVADDEPKSNSDDPNESPANDPAPPDKLVSDAFYDDSHQNTYGGVFSIPKINLPSPEIQSINDEIYEMLYTNLVEDLLLNWDEDQNGGEQIRYTWRQIDDTLSLIIEVHPVHWEWTEFYVYNISVSEERQLSDDEVIDRSNINNYQETARKALETTFWERYSTAPRETAEEARYFNELLNKTRSDENIDAAQPFFGVQGNLSIVVSIYSFAGAEYYPDIVNLEDFYYKPEYSQEAPVPETKPAPSPTKGSDSEYIIPDSDTRLLDESDLYGLSKFECWVALDELYARHGRTFGNQEIMDHFNSTSWYYGYISGEEFDSNLDFYLNTTEKRNIETIVAYMKKMGWR